MIINMIEADTEYKNLENSLLKEFKETYDREIKNELRNGIMFHLTIKIRNKKLVGVETLKNRNLQ